MKKVKGALFLDYVRMLKSDKEADVKRFLMPGDFAYLEKTISPTDWYPFDTFERMGLAILDKIGSSNMDLVRNWGKASIDDLVKTNPSLVCEDDPRESLMRFHVLRRSFFNFNAIDIHNLAGDRAMLTVNYGMCRLAEEAATWQALGFFERLLELSGGSGVEHKFVGKSWEGDRTTVIRLGWKKDIKTRKIKGILFKDYVRVLKERKELDLKRYLKPEDLVYFNQEIDNSAWYPFSAFERMGLVIIKEIAKSDMHALHQWGRLLMGNIVKNSPTLICAGDPMESLLRFHVYRRSFLNFGAFYVEYITENYAKIEMCYGTNKLAEEAATYQALGFFEILLEKSGARNIQHTFLSRLWMGDSCTMLELSWEI